MKKLNEYNLCDLLVKRKNAGVPILGICLGMQILFEYGFEGEKTKGLGFLKGNVDIIKTSKKLPHIGWNELFINKNNDIVKDMDE